jgi:hypothetical protein
MPGTPAGGLVPRQASPTEQFTQMRARPRPYVLDQPTSPVNAAVPHQTDNSGPLPIAPPQGEQGEGKAAVESQTQPHQAAVSRRGVA